MFPRRKPSLWTRSPTCAASPGTVVPLRTETVTSWGLSGGWWAARPLPDEALEWVEDELAPPTWLTANARAPPMISTPVTARTRYSGRPRSTRRYQGSAGAREKGREVVAREPPGRAAVRRAAAPSAPGRRRPSSRWWPGRRRAPLPARWRRLGPVGRPRWRPRGWRRWRRPGPE